jgi:hypothetical protein
MTVPLGRDVYVFPPTTLQLPSNLCVFFSQYARTHPSRTKQYRPATPPASELKQERNYEDASLPEQRRLASSDLEDCEEVWIGEVDEYILDTQKRRNQVEAWFEASVLVSFLRLSSHNSGVKESLYRNATQ